MLSAKARKQDAHEKIQLGGLAVMAGLREADKALVLGALLSLKQALDTQDERVLQNYRELGQQGFLAKQIAETEGDSG